jgi:hypothetical protein
MPNLNIRQKIVNIINFTEKLFLHAHLQVVYYKCAKFHKNPTSSLGGVALTRYMDGPGDSYIPPNFACGGIDA